MESIRVLDVDDDPDFAEMVVVHLERQSDRIEVVTETSASDGLDRLQEEGRAIDCIVSDYEMPHLNGLEFLEGVRESYPDLPFILFTGKGSEEVASDAIAAGATDYLRKKSGTERYELLANRIENAVEQYRSRRERDRVFRALETATQGIAILEADGEYVYVNEAYAALYGWTPAELEGHHWEVLYPADEVHRFETEILPTLAAEGTWTGQSRGLREDGTTFDEQLSLSMLSSGGHVCVVTDLTDVAAREAELQRIERRYRAVFEDPNILVGLLDPDGTLQEVNTTAMEYVDDVAESVVGNPFWETPWWNHSQASRQDLKGWIKRAADGEYVEYETDHEIRDGETISVEGTIRPVTADDGRVEALIASARDVTDRKRRERRLERQNERFDDLAEVISHDLQTPLSAARGRIELARDGADAQEHVAKALEALDRVDEMRRDIVDVLRSREIVGETLTVGLGAVVTDAWTAVRGSDEASLSIEGDPEAECDPAAVTRLFENLISNSVEHGGENVAVRVGPTPRGFYYEDDGPGIEPSDREAVFTAGYSTKGSGSGVGLTSVRQIVDAHGWSIAVEDPNHLDGVRFCVSI